MWKKKAAPVRQKRTYKTAEEVLEEGTAAGDGGAAGSRGGLTSQPILDLRGPQARLVTDLQQLNAATGELGWEVLVRLSLFIICVPQPPKPCMRWGGVEEWSVREGHSFGRRAAQVLRLLWSVSLHHKRHRGNCQAW